MTRPTVDVVVLTWNDGELLDTAVASALGSCDVDVNVIVVDNASTDPARVVDDPRVRLIRNEVNRGVAGGRNQGIAQGDAELICLLDSDAALEPTALHALVSPLLTDERVAVAGPVFLDQPAEASGGRAPTLRRKLQRSFGRTDTYDPVPRADGAPWWDVDFVIGACQVIRRAAYDSVGGIDESFFYGPEDADFCMRLREANWRVVQVADAPVAHPPRRRYRRAINRKGLEHGWAVARFLWRHRRYHTVAS
jgi:GT2 family glycosyltransferase